MSAFDTAAPAGGVRIGFAGRIGRAVVSALPLGVRKLVWARREVRAALRRGDLDHPVAPLPDAVSASELPSTATLGLADRVLAEIDQDGFAFAVHEADEPVFNRRADRLPRRRYRLEIVLEGGEVLLRKQFARQPLELGLRDWIWSSLALPFYSEAAALLRLRGVGCVPNVRSLDPATWTIVMDYIPGTNVRQLIASAAAVHDLDVEAHDSLRVLPPAERDRREIELLAGVFGAALASEVDRVSQEIVARGVAPIDVKAGNIIRGARTGRLYWVDFETAHLSSAPGWDAHARRHRELVHRWFGGKTGSPRRTNAGDSRQETGDGRQ
jgi:hypothetical protein